MNRKRIIVTVGATVVAAAVLTGGYRLYGELSASGERPTFNAEWQRCESTDVCVAVPAPCEDWEPANVRHRDAATAYYAHLMTVIESTELWCPSKKNPMVTPYAICLSGQCALVQ